MAPVSKANLATALSEANAIVAHLEARTEAQALRIRELEHEVKVSGMTLEDVRTQHADDVEAIRADLAAVGKERDAWRDAANALKKASEAVGHQYQERMRNAELRADDADRRALEAEARLQRALGFIDHATGRSFPGLDGPSAGGQANRRTSSIEGADRPVTARS